MDPSNEEAKKLTSINAVLDWVGMRGLGPGEVRSSFLNLFGWSGAEHPRMVAVIKPKDFDQVMSQWRLGIGAWREPMPAQKGQASLVGRACRFLCGEPQGDTNEVLNSMGSCEQSASQEKSKAIAFIIYAKPNAFEIMPASVSMFRGQYREHSWNHGKCVYKRVKVKGQEFLPEVFLFFWDERQGKESSGWYCGSDVGAGQVWAWNPSVLPLPPRQGWRCPVDGPELEYITCVPPVRPSRASLVKQEVDSDEDKQSNKRKSVQPSKSNSKRMRVKVEEEQEISTESAWGLTIRVESDAEEALEYSRVVFAEASMLGQRDFAIASCTSAIERLKEHARRLEEAAGRLNHSSCVVKVEKGADSEELELLAKKMQIMLGDVQEELNRQSNHLEFLRSGQ